MDEANALPRLSRANLSDEVYEALKEGIFRKHFAPGERLDLGKIEREMGVSRTPVKVALNRLAVEGLVEIVPRSGTYVTSPTTSAVDVLA